MIHLLFSFAKSKGYQQGGKHVGPWHVYANHFKPWICPVLALAWYLFSFPDVLKGYRPLFDGGSQYNRYTMDELNDDLFELGYESGLILSQKNSTAEDAKLVISNKQIHEIIE